jgi:hypothetical protein
MTYNFDPERWRDDHRAALIARRGRGELDEDAFAAALAEIERRYEAIVARLDGTFTLPARPPAE